MSVGAARLVRAATALWVLWALLVNGFSGAVVVRPVLYAGVFGAGWLLVERWPGRVTATGYGAASLLALIHGLRFTISDLGHPESALGFIFGMIPPVAVALGLTAALSVWVTLTNRQVIVALGVLGALFLAGVTTQLGDYVLLARDLEYIPDAAAIEAGETGLLVENRDVFRHTFTIEEVGIEVELPAGAARRITLDLPEGRYLVTCSVPGHRAMKVKLTVGG